MAGSEVRERHPEGATDLAVEMVDFAGESVWWKPFAHGVGVEKRAIHFFRSRTKDAVKADGIGRGHGFSFRAGCGDEVQFG